MKTSSVTDYLASLAWDGTPRLDRWLIDCAGAEDNAYVRAVSRLMLVAAVRRARNPGCVFDEMPLLAGALRSGKSRALRVLAVEDSWFSDDLPLAGEARRFTVATNGKWIVVARKVQNLCSASADVASFKAILSRKHDFGPKDMRVPRQFVIIGTTNVTEGPFIEATGNRRFWPVRVQRFDLERLRDGRSQLWAEAAKVEAIGKSIRIDPRLFEASK
jgi:predicted P-loop ATPase